MDGQTGKQRQTNYIKNIFLKVDTGATLDIMKTTRASLLFQTDFSAVLREYIVSVLISKFHNINLCSQ